MNTKNMIDGHEYVDLGLPSGTLWATCNVGANTPTENGDFFAWGETEPKKDYSWATYKYEEESNKSIDDGDSLWLGISKYTVADSVNEDVVSVAWYDSKGNFIGDSLTTLLAEDDAATVNWGAGWRMPTHTEQKELLEGCKWEWTTDFNGSGVAGRIGTSKTNCNIIFLPAAGFRHGTDLYSAGYNGYCWSSSLYENVSSNAYYLYFYSKIISWSDDHRDYGKSVRAVAK